MGCNWPSLWLSITAETRVSHWTWPHSDNETRSSQSSICGEMWNSQARIEVETRSYTDLHLCWKREATHARVLMLKTRPWGLCLKKQHDHRVWKKLRSSHLRLERCLTKDVKFVFGFRSDLAFGIRPTFEAGTRPPRLWGSHLRLCLQ